MVEYFKFPWDLEDREPYMDLPFPMEEYERRIDTVRESMEDRGLDYLFVVANRRETGHVRWISNFYGILGETVLVVPRTGDLTLATTAAVHGEPMDSYITDTWIEDVRAGIFQDVGGDVPDLAGIVDEYVRENDAGEATVGVVNEHVASHGFLSEVKAAHPGIDWVNALSLYERAKASKSDLELEMIEHAAEAGDAALRTALDVAEPGVTELEVAGEIERTLRREGMENVAVLFDTRVLTGPRSGLKNGIPRDVEMEEGDMIYIDLSASYRGYVLDCATSTVIGEPDEEQRNFLECAAEMSEAVVDAAEPGLETSELVEVAREVAVEWGEEDRFLDYHSGHGMGTSQLEMPRISPLSDEVLRPGYVFAVEPMLVEKGFGTGTIEGICAITDDGARWLSKMDRRPWRR